MLQPGARVLLVQVAVGLIVASCAVSSGMSLGFSAVVDQPLLESPDNLTDDQVSWFVSLASVATPLGCLTVGPLLDAVGRRPTLLVLNAPFLLGWVLLATSPSGGTAQMYAGRLFTGFATGMASVPATVYLGEMSQARLRGMFVTWTSVAISVGILVVYLLGTGFREDWRYAAWACAALPVISAPLVALVVPESPPWLNQKGRAEAAEASLRRLRAVGGRAPLPPALAEELAGLPPPRAPPPDGERRSALALLRATGAELARPAAWKPLLIMNVFFLFQQITGIYVVVGYAVRIATEAQVTIDTYVMSVLMGAVQVVAGAGVSFALRFWRRRPLSVWSGIVQTLSMVTLGVYLHVDTDDARWLSLAALLVYVVAGALGLHTLPWAMLGEVFPARVRGVAAGLTTCAAYLYNFAMLKAYPSLSEACQHASARGTSEYLFYMFAGTSALSVVFMQLWLPETHGRTAREIEEAFSGRRLSTPSLGGKGEDFRADQDERPADAPELKIKE